MWGRIVFGIIILSQLTGFTCILYEINGGRLNFNEIDNFAFLNFWLAFLSMLFTLIGIVLPYLGYLFMQNNMQIKMDKKIEEMDKIENKINNLAYEATKIAFLLSSASMRISEKDYLGAIRRYNEAITINPNHASIYSSRGFCKNNLEMYKDAIDDCSKAIELDVNDVNAYLNRGAAKANLGQKQQKIDILKDSIKDFDKAIELESDNELAIQNKKVIEGIIAILEQEQQISSTNEHRNT